MKVLNLYAGIGGNRKLWEDVEVIAIEINPSIANVYQDFFPNDKVIVTDAHSYLLNHFEEYDFIWSSPPCPSHSQIRIYTEVARGSSKPVYPDMKLYEEVLLLKHYFKGKWCVENVISFYKPLIKPYEMSRHYFWTNFHITNMNINKKRHCYTIKELQDAKGFDLTGKSVGHRKDQVLRNCVVPELGLHILNESKIELQPELFT